MSAAPARCWWPGRTASTPPSGPPVNACLVPAAALDGQEVVTAEGLGSPDDAAPGAAGAGRARRLAVRLLHAGVRVQHGRRVLPAGRAPDAAPDHEHGPNGFDLHALSGNLCRCTGYRPIRDAAWALGRPLDDDPLADRARPPRPGSGAHPARRAGRRVRPPGATSPRPSPCSPSSPDATVVAGSTDWGVEVNLRGARVGVRRGGRPAARAARGLDRSRPIEIGAALTLSRGRGGARRRGAAARRAVPAVRLPADPQRRHHRRQPRHRLPDRRPRAGPARARRGPGAGLAPRATARCRWPTTSPATARPCCARTS